MRSSLLASVVVIEFQTTEAYASFDLSKVQYSIYREPREEKGKVIVRDTSKINNYDDNDDVDNNNDNEIIKDYIFNFMPVYRYYINMYL
jgi:hypothetical protein